MPFSSERRGFIKLQCENVQPLQWRARNCQHSRLFASCSVVFILASIQPPMCSVVLFSICTSQTPVMSISFDPHHTLPCCRSPTFFYFHVLAFNFFNEIFYMRENMKYVFIRLAQFSQHNYFGFHKFLHAFCYFKKQIYIFSVCVYVCVWVFIRIDASFVFLNGSYRCLQTNCCPCWHLTSGCQFTNMVVCFY